MAVIYKNQGLQAIRAGLKDAIREGQTQAAKYVAELAYQLCPVGPDREDHTHLRDTIRVEERKGKIVVVAGGKDDVTYAAAVEYGTYSSPAQPFLTPALEAIDVDQEVGKAVAALITRNGL